MPTGLMGVPWPGDFYPESSSLVVEKLGLILLI